MDPKNIEAATKLLDAIAWPVVALIAGGVLLARAPSILRLVKRVPLIRKIAFQGFEIELDLNNINELQDQTDRALIALVQKTDKEIQSIIRLSGLVECLESLGDYLYQNVPLKSSIAKADGNLRCTVHIRDSVFSEYLYQACNYYSPWTKIYHSHPRTSGRRFSIRYGIIGLASRTRQSQVEWNALRGDERQVENLISHWSMTTGEAEGAKGKPSCLAVVLKNPETSAFLGIFYADASDSEYFGKEDVAKEFIAKIQTSEEFTKLLAAASAVHNVSSQIQVAIDLNQIENLRS